MVVDVGGGDVVGGGRRGTVDVRGGGVRALHVAGVVRREVPDDLTIGGEHGLARGVVDGARRRGFAAVGGEVRLVHTRPTRIARRQGDGDVVVDIGGGHVVGRHRRGDVHGEGAGSGTRVSGGVALCHLCGVGGLR